MFKKNQTAPASASSVAADPVVTEAYFHNVRTFGQSRTDAAERSAKIAWCVAGAAAVGLTAACIAIAGLTPLKSTEVTAFRVDATTGSVERVYDVRAEKTSIPEASKRYFLWQYVRLREGYAFAEAAATYDSVSLMSSQTVQAQYFEATRGSNKESPQVRLGRDGLAQVTHISTAFLDQGKSDQKLGQVRFVVQETKGGIKQAPRHMVATIGFDFAPGKLSASQILVNPLGFIVTSYHADPEAAQ